MKNANSLQEVIEKVEEKGGYIDGHDGKFYPVDKFAGVCMLESGSIGFLMNAPIFCINACWIRDDDLVYLSQCSISGTLIHKDITKKEDWEEFNMNLLSSKITEVLLKDGTHICL